MKKTREIEERRKNSTGKINPVAWFSILGPEQFTSAPAQERTSGENRDYQLLPPQSPAQTYKTNILLPKVLKEVLITSLINSFNKRQRMLSLNVKAKLF